mgnify:CR=1 FL=1
MAYKPLNHIERFKHVDIYRTDVRRTWKRERDRLKALAESEAKAKTEHAEAAARLFAEQQEQAAADEAERLAKVAPMRKAAK